MACYSIRPPYYNVGISLCLLQSENPACVMFESEPSLQLCVKNNSFSHRFLQCYSECDSEPVNWDLIRELLEGPLLQNFVQNVQAGEFKPVLAGRSFVVLLINHIGTGR